MKTAKSTNRRKFLLAAGLGGAGVAAAVVANGRKNPVTGKAEAEAAATNTAYRETDHIRKYYKTTEV